MSTATAFKYYRAFPFCASETRAPDSYDYVDLDETDGDEGLAEAMRLWWLIEVAKLRPTGAIDDGGTTIYFQDPIGGLDASFGTAPGDLEPGDTFETAGAFSNGVMLSAPNAFTPIEPKGRVCFSETNFSTEAQTVGDIAYCQSSLATREGADISAILHLNVAYDSGAARWRLCYSFDFQLSGSSSTINVYNPARGGTPDGSGTFDFAGYTLDFDYATNSASIVETPDIEVDLGFYTF